MKGTRMKEMITNQRSSWLLYGTRAKCFSVFEELWVEFMKSRHFLDFFCDKFWSPELRANYPHAHATGADFPIKFHPGAHGHSILEAPAVYVWSKRMCVANCSGPRNSSREDSIEMFPLFVFFRLILDEKQNKWCSHILFDWDNYLAMSTKGR